MNTSIKTNYIIITGAASGIGKEFADNYAKQGYPLILIDKNEIPLGEVSSELRKKYGTEIHELVKDLSLPESPREIHDYATGNSLVVTGLINNAGFGIYGKFSETNLATELKMVNLHVSTPVSLIKYFLPAMLERNEGEILNVSSLAGFQPGPMMSVYYSTKAFLISFTEAIAREHRKSGVKICVLCPGVTRTNFKQSVCEDSKARINSLDYCPAKVAQYGVDSMRKGRVVAIPTFTNKFLSFLPRILPRSTVRHIVYKIQLKNRGN